MITYINQFLKSSKEILIGQLIIKIVTILSIPIITRIFIPSEFGQLDVVDTLMYLFSGIIILGTDSAMGYYYFDKEKGRKEIVSTVFTFRLISSIIYIGILLLFYSNIASLLQIHENIVLFALSSAVFICFIEFFQDLLKFKYLNKLYIVLVGITGISITLTNIIFAYLGGLNYLVVFRFLNYLIIVLILFIIFFKNYRITIKMQYLKKILLYGLPLLPMTLLFWLMSYIDRYFLLYLTDYTSIGIYGIAARFSRYIVFILSPIVMAWGPISMNIKNEDYAFKFYINTMNIFLFIGFILTFVFIFISEIMVVLLTPKEYFQSYKIIGLLCLGFVFNNAYFISNIGISLSKKTIYTSLAAFIGVLINITGNSVLIPKYGISGAAFSTMFSFILMFIINAYFSKTLYKINFFTKNTLLILFSGFVFFIIINYINNNIYIYLYKYIINFILMTFYVIAVVYLGLVDFKKIKRYL